MNIANQGDKDKDMLFGSFASTLEAPASSTHPTPDATTRKTPKSGAQPSSSQTSFVSTNKSSEFIPPANHHSDAAAQNVKEQNSCANRAKMRTDRSLKRLAPMVLSPEGISQVLIPDEVFIRGAEAHKDYVLGVFTGKPPYFSQIQSVLTHIWGRGTKLQIHLRPASRSMLVKVPNDFIRNKIVEQEIWHIGTSLFYVTQWSAEVAISPPTMTSIPLWAHVRGVPFDLYTREGLSLVAGLIGHPVEADEFTIKMVSLEVAHLKVRADCTKPLPDVVELVRQDGSFIPVSVSYPWVPPSCPCCKQLGHRESRCPNARWAPAKSADSQPKDMDSTPSDNLMRTSSKDTSNPSDKVIPEPSEDPSTPTVNIGNSNTWPLIISTSSCQSSMVFGSQRKGNLASGCELIHKSDKSSIVAASPAGVSTLATYDTSDLAVGKYSFQKPSKKRKGSQISRRGSPETFPSKSELYPSATVSRTNPFVCLDLLRQDLASSANLSESFLPSSESVTEDFLLSKEANNAITLPLQNVEPPELPLYTPTMGSSPPEEKKQL
ncbi:hypothetical protein Bca4012_083329 [Brassica carinata]